MQRQDIFSAADLIGFIQKVGFLPFWGGPIPGFSAEELVDETCCYQSFPDGGWEWLLWDWKGPIVQDGQTVYGKFFAGKAGFVSKEWFPHLLNYRRAQQQELGPVEQAALQTLRESGPMITRDLRAACGFGGAKMRSRFDSYVTRLQMQTLVVTEDFVYPHNRYGKSYGWGWSLLSTPEMLYGKEYCQTPLQDDGRPSTAEESYDCMLTHLRNILPNIQDKQIRQLLA